LDSDHYEITQSQVEEIRDIVKDATGKDMPFNDVLRMVDLFKRFEQEGDISKLVKE
jgi:hypothetical protein